ncbi:MAG TPA: response regulator [Vicinamibacterales bacterium]|nr:response regulator [Vicinamibacterales bacterium]
MAHTLLLADDSVTIQRVIELTFADEDIKVVAVSDGDQAIARLDAAPPDIVLADIGMPGRNGYEVAQYVKRSPKLSKIPVVLLTGAFEPVDQARAAEAGCDGILAKPFEPQLVIARVKELLGVGGAAKPPKPAAEVAQPVAPQTGSKDYFDRLDAAFASASAAPPPALVTASKLPNPPESKPAGVPPPQKQDDMDLPLAAPNPPPSAAAASDASMAETIAVPRASVPPRPADPGENDATRPMAATPRPNAPPAQMPALADAFAALLAAEQAEPLPPSVPTWPASGPPADAIAEQVFRRVLAEMSDKAVRETVTSLVSQIAERLVREEIDRIKASIKV